MRMLMVSYLPSVWESQNINFKKNNLSKSSHSQFYHFTRNLENLSDKNKIIHNV